MPLPENSNGRHAGVNINDLKNDFQGKAGHALFWMRSSGLNWPDLVPNGQGAISLPENCRPRVFTA
ncbi:MAG: hypothetical protein KDK30_17790 [Leptospiraceae bacterium]|nr:hypothetical protein [Leptospiraceae bacterium]MCB1323327.1 hypothetical protein [Leptospiraceae bacterium]